MVWHTVLQFVELQCNNWLRLQGGSRGCSPSQAAALVALPGEGVGM